LDLGKSRRLAVVALALGALAGFPVSAFTWWQRAESKPAQVRVHARRPGCSVFLDDVPAGKTDAQGEALIQNIDPSDHYIHVDCPGEAEQGFLVTPRGGETLDLEAGPAKGPTLTPEEAAEERLKLEPLIKEAVQLRAQGRLEEAVERLREVAKLDPENSDLHRELGITFLLGKDWKRGRVEMLEAIRHDPTDADAHNGLGYALEKMGDLDDALKEYRTATRLEPDDPTYRQHYFDALTRVAAKQEEKTRKK
jgi:tetratricopeptide (TPR) repeat protein